MGDKVAARWKSHPPQGEARFQRENILLFSDSLDIVESRLRFVSSAVWEPVYESFSDCATGIHGKTVRHLCTSGKHALVVIAMFDLI